MMPIRVAGAAVEPVSPTELRGYLRLDPEDDAEDTLLADLIAGARASLEAETRRILVPGTWRTVLDRLPGDGRVPLPLSPLVALLRAGFCEADGSVADLAPGLVALSADRSEAPGLTLSPAFPDAAGRGLFVEVSAGYGGEGPPLPPPLRIAILRLAAARYEHRGDDGFADAPERAAAAPFRRLRL